MIVDITEPNVNITLLAWNSYTYNSGGLFATNQYNKCLGMVMPINDLNGEFK